MGKAKVEFKGGLRVREDNRRDAKIVRVIPYGEEFEFEDEHGTWLKLSDGWVKADFTDVTEGGGSGGVSSWNDLTDKPFYANTTIVECDGNIEGLTPHPDAPDFYKVSDFIPMVEEVIGASFTVAFDGGEETVFIAEEDVYSWDGGYSIQEAVWVETSQVDLGDGVFVSPGIYFAINAGAFFVKSFEFGETKTLDKKFIQKASGNTAGIIAPYEIPTAMKTEIVEVSEGVTTYGDAVKASMFKTVPLYVNYERQLIYCLHSTNQGYDGMYYVMFTLLSPDNQIKKLTLTFGSDADDALLESVTEDGLVFDEVVVKSSTAGSSKQFKITVDDSGTVTATEIGGK